MTKPLPLRPFKTVAETSGPYWVSTSETGEHRVCGRNGTTMFRYPANMEAAALQHAKRLQRGYSATDKAIRDAAPAMLQLLKDCE